jgi:hypothetical protein
MPGSAPRWRTADLYSCGQRRPRTGRASRLDRTEVCSAPILGARAGRGSLADLARGCCGGESGLVRSRRIVGVTPYMDAVLDLPEVTVIAEYPRMLGYSLLARPGTRQHEITEVFAHPVAFVEARPWLDRVMPYVRRTETASGGAAAQRVANSPTLLISP